jgi:hypothetical protein
MTAYELAVEIVWGSLSPWVGNLGAKAIVSRSADLAGRSFEFLQRVRVTETGLDRERLRVALRGIPCPRAAEGLEGLLLQVVEVVRGLTGDILSDPMLATLSAYK